MAIKGYLTDSGLSKLTSYIKGNLGFKYLRLNFQDAESQQITLDWNDNFYGVNTRNGMDFGNEILFKIPALSIPLHLTLHISDSGIPLVATFYVDFLEPDGIIGDAVLLYDRIELLFPIKNTAI